jgi:pyruvate kinase
VRSATDVEQVTKVLDGVGADHLGLVLKIETAQGFRELPSILLAAMRRARAGLDDRPRRPGRRGGIRAHV